MTESYVIKNYISQYGEKIYNIQLRYKDLYPECTVVPAEVYDNYPGFDNGKNIICIFDPQENLLGYSDIYPYFIEIESEPDTFWTEIKVDFSNSNFDKIRDTLYEKTIGRAMEIKRKNNSRMIFQYYSTETESKNYIISKNFDNNGNIYKMSRNLNQEISNHNLNTNYNIVKTKLETDEEKERYLKARNSVLTANPWNIETLNTFLSSPVWKEGTAILIYDEDIIIGGIFIYNPEGAEFGFTEEIFVLPEFRKKGLASYLITEGMKHLKSLNTGYALLELLEKNETALSLYKNLGYEISSIQHMFEKYI